MRPALIILFLSVLILAGCKENVLINSKVSPANNTIELYSTSIDCITRTYFDDSLVTSVNFSGIPIVHGAGSLADPYFGTMTGTSFFQIVPPDFSATHYDNRTVDSAFLVLPYAGFTYGDTGDHSVTQTYQVFYMQEALEWDAVYYSFTTKAIDATFPLSEPTTIRIHDLLDSVGTTNVKNYPGLRIKLKLPTIMSKLIAAHASLNGSTNPIPDFQNAFKGICVRVADTRQSTTAFPYFRLDGNTIYSQAGIHVHSRGTGSTPDTLVEAYVFNPANCSHFNNITKSYSRSPVNTLYTSKEANAEIVALQNQPGAAIDVIVPGLNSLPAGIINKAELQFTLLPGTYNTSKLPVPEKIYPQAIASSTYPDGITGNGVEYVLADYYPLGSLSPLNILDGYLHTFERNGTTVKTFTINIPREVMNSIKAKNDTLHLHINGTKDYYGAYHMIAGGGNYPDALYRPKLFVVYSKMN